MFCVQNVNLSRLNAPQSFIYISCIHSLTSIIKVHAKNFNLKYRSWICGGVGGMKMWEGHIFFIGTPTQLSFKVTLNGYAHIQSRVTL